MGIRRYATIVIVGLIAAGGLVISAKKSELDPAARNKARHYYLSAARYEAEGKSAEGAELFRKAYEADSTYAEAALEYGVRRWGMPVGQLATPGERERSRRISRRFVDRYPGDLFPNLLYSNVMEQSGELEESISVLEGMLQHNAGNSDILQMLSGLYLDTDEPEKAMDALDKYARIEGEDQEYFVRKAGMRLALKDTLGALAEVQRMIDKNPKDPAGLAFRARMEAYFGKKDEALESFRQAEALCPPGGGGPIKMQIAEFYLNQEDSVNYDKKTYEALIADDLDFPVKRELLAFYLQGLVDNKGEWARGDRLFSVLLDQYPHEPELLSLSSRYSAAKKDYAKALEDIDYAIDLDHTQTSYWEQALMYAMLADDDKRSEEYFKNAIEKLENPSMAIYSIAGGTALMAERPERALEIYTEELNRFFPGQTPGEPMNMEALNKTLTADGVDRLAALYQEMGDAYFQLGDKPRTFQSYDNSLILNNGSALTLNNYAYFLVKDGKDMSEETLRKADEMSKKAVTLAPDQPTYLDTRAWVLFRKGEYKEAKDVQLKALELLGEGAEASGEAEFNEHLGDILFMNQEPEEALDAWKRALKGNPDSELLQRKVKHKTFYYE
ncbi:MAG: tetratricopeptide repeat protein [Muribaculaceae bacterium]|nr:tetratricopeptide repeat protein [Muribaculaceae bacterium]